MRNQYLILLTVLSLATLAAAPPVLAIEGGTAELGVFGRVTYFDPAFEIADWGGLGLRAGYFLVKDLALEADASFTSTDGVISDGLRQDVQVMPFHARLIWNRPTGEKTHLLLGAGYVHTEYGDDANASSDGAGALVGLRYEMLKDVSFRFEATADWYSKTDFTTASDPIDYGVQFGFSGLFGNGPGDRDKDGVTDDLDKCPETPVGDAVDAVGCTLPKDSDGDGITDDLDKCPGTPVGEAVDARGCPLPKDSDGDGVLDNADKCPGTPKGDKVDATGCPLPKDSDGDGVLDNADKCPQTPKGAKVDKDGCQASIILEGVNFRTGSADLTPEARAILDGVATQLSTAPTVRVEVSGYTDNKGQQAMNMKLSERRADTVRKYLIGKGVAADRLTAKGHGPDKPVASNDTEEGRAKNRRIELNKID